eukprot:TRINITY_DN29819_c0_g1_i1.p1 TRINITY_DN29819_c0_g1~~TRINITY_DN29819_c0_g1_i1.p1  ORF type:complete len:529 (-),score=110.21 TRINITY_DN29819_c0_g1_i1:52-1605(-)
MASPCLHAVGMRVPTSAWPGTGIARRQPQGSEARARAAAAMTSPCWSGRSSSSASAVLAGLLLGTAACGKSSRSSRGSATVAAASSLKTAPAAAAAAASPAIEQTLAETCKSCLEDLGDPASSSFRARRWTVEADEEDDMIFYSRYRVDQIPAGQGRAVGNTLRRTLMRQDLFRSHAAVAFRMQHRSFDATQGNVHVSRAEPALHEFSSMPGVLETMIDVVRNVQQLAVAKAPWQAPELPIAGLAARAADEPETWRWALRRCGPCAVQAGDLDIVDSSTFYERPVTLAIPEQHLFQMTAPTMVEMEVIATCCSQTEWEQSPTFQKYQQRLRFDGFLMVPPLFSPVKKVNYTVTAGEPVPGEVEPSEVVQLELWTKKSARPSELLRTSAETLWWGLASRASRNGEDTLLDDAAAYFGEPGLLEASKKPRSAREGHSDDGIHWQPIIDGRASLQEVQAAADKLEGGDFSGQGRSQQDLMAKDGLAELLDGVVLNPESLQPGADVIQERLSGKWTESLLD